MNSCRRLGLLVSGGDAPGVNAAIEAAARRAAASGVELWGVQGGFAGLASGQMRPLLPEDVPGLASRGGSWLGTSRDRIVASAQGRGQLLEAIQAKQLQGIVLLGGDGSIRYGARALVEKGVPCVAIPCSIDNDVPGTDRTVGFDTACNLAISLADRILDTAQSLPGRMFVLETLGGNTGHIALAVAEAIHADLVLLPEYALDLDYAAQRMRRAVAARGYALAVASEGAGDVKAMGEYMARIAGHRVRLTSIGHAQRGGPPSFFDRWLAARFAALAVDSLASGHGGAVTVWRGGAFGLAPIEEVAAGSKLPDRLTYNAINGL